ncbi:hypothetical protein, partial [Comamonas kerstersii]
KGCVVLLPIGGAIAGLEGMTHAASLPLEEQRFMQQRRFQARPVPLCIFKLRICMLHLQAQKFLTFQ